MTPTTPGFPGCLLGLFYAALLGTLGILIVPAAVETGSNPSMNEYAEIFSAGNADVLTVEAVQTAADAWTFTVTVEHPDTGWDDYADGWDVVLPDGTVAKPNPADAFTRVLLHPHENEQPFTRSQSGIVLPEGVTEVRVRAHDLVDGYGGKEVTVDLTRDAGPDFEVERRG